MPALYSTSDHGLTILYEFLKINRFNFAENPINHSVFGLVEHKLESKLKFIVHNSNIS